MKISLLQVSRLIALVHRLAKLVLWKCQPYLCHGNLLLLVGPDSVAL